MMVMNEASQLTMGVLRAMSMMTLSNSIYCALKRQGIHNWGYLPNRQLDLDLSDMDLDEWDTPDLDIFHLEFEE
jgi:hypothetical protein